MAPATQKFRWFSADGAAEEAQREVDFYKVLGLPKSADSKRIKQAYIKKAALWHPDRNHHTPELAKYAHRHPCSCCVGFDTSENCELVVN